MFAICYVSELEWYQNESVEEGGFGRVVGRNNPWHVEVAAFSFGAKVDQVDLQTAVL